jgi:hypothetical protein
MGILDAVVASDELDLAVVTRASELALIDSAAFSANKNWLNREVRANLLLAHTAENAVHPH